jgi:hypothetical protein
MNSGDIFCAFAIISGFLSSGTTMLYFVVTFDGSIIVNVSTFILPGKTLSFIVAVEPIERLNDVVLDTGTGTPPPPSSWYK